MRRRSESRGPYAPDNPGDSPFFFPLTRIADAPSRNVSSSSSSARPATKHRCVRSSMVPRDGLRSTLRNWSGPPSAVSRLSLRLWALAGWLVWKTVPFRTRTIALLHCPIFTAATTFQSPSPELIKPCAPPPRLSPQRLVKDFRRWTTRPSRG